MGPECYLLPNHRQGCFFPSNLKLHKICSQKESFFTLGNGGIVDGERTENLLRKKLPLTLFSNMILKILRFDKFL